jgi:hypothetical protein
MSLAPTHVSANLASSDAGADPPASERAPARRRVVVAAPTIPLRPVWISQETSLLVGFKPRRYLEFLRANPSIPRVHDGKLVLSQVEAIERRLLELAGCGQAQERAEIHDDNDPTDALSDPDAILALVGRKRKAGGTR